MFLFTGSKFHATNAAGAPLAGGKVWTYAAGTLTLLTTYKDQAGSLTNTNPVILDATGRANIWLQPLLAYRFIVTDASDVMAPDGDVDNISGGIGPTDLASSATGLGTALLGWIRNLTGAVATTLYRWLRWQYSTPLEFMTAAQQDDVLSKTGAIDVTAALASWANSGKKRGWIPEGKYLVSDEITHLAAFSMFGDGINAVEFVQVTANKGVWNTNIGATLAYVTWDGFKCTGAGRGAATSIGIHMGDTTYGTDYCKVTNVEATNFGLAQILIDNGIRTTVDEAYLHGDPTGVLPAADHGLYMRGSYGFAGSNYDNRIGYVEAYNNVYDIGVLNGGKNNFEKVYTYNQNYTGTIHHIWEQNSSLNSWNRPHIEPLSLSAGGTAMWLIESTLTNPYTYMLGPRIIGLEYENGTLATTTNVVQIGTSAGNIVYGTEILDAKCMPVSAGKFHVVMTNEQTSRISGTARNNSFPFDLILRELTISNPNAATNHSYVGSRFDGHADVFTVGIFAGAGAGASLGTLTGTARWNLNGKNLNFSMDVTMSAKTGNTGAVAIHGIEAISPNAGSNTFTFKTAGQAIPVSCLIVGLATSYPVAAYLNTTTGYIQFYNTTFTAVLTDTSFANGTEISLSGKVEIL